MNFAILRYGLRACGIRTPLCQGQRLSCRSPCSLNRGLVQVLLWTRVLIVYGIYHLLDNVSYRAILSAWYCCNYTIMGGPLQGRGNVQPLQTLKPEPRGLAEGSQICRWYIQVGWRRVTSLKPQREPRFRV